MATTKRIITDLNAELKNLTSGHNVKQYVLTMLAYRYVSFLISEELKKRNVTTDEEAEKYKTEIIKEKGLFIYPSDSFEILKEKDIEGIQNSINRTNESTKGTKLEDIFSFIEFDSVQLGNTKEQRAERVETLIKGIEKLPLSEEVISLVYEILLNKFAANGGKGGGEYFTPTTVSMLLSEIVTSDKKDIKSIYDCACGSGNLLLQLAKKLSDEKVEVYGQEINIVTGNLCKLNLLLSGVNYNNINISIGDTLKEPKNLDKKISAIVANPPYSVKWEGNSNKSLLESEIYKEVGVLPPRNYCDLCFVLHSLYMLEEEGTAAIVLPHGVLFRQGAENKIIKYLVDNNYIDAIIGLPAKIFLNTDIPTVIIVLKKSKQGKEVLFIDAKKEFVKGRPNELRQENIEKILNCYKERKIVEKFSNLVSYEEIKGNEYNLNIPRYVDTYEEEPVKDLGTIAREYSEINKLIKQTEKELIEMLTNMTSTDQKEVENLTNLINVLGGGIR